MIPKTIHYCWFGGKPLSIDVKKCIKSWKKMCPEYEIKCWNEHNFDVFSHPFVKTAYEAKAWAFVSDYARLKIIYENGGIYLDTDVELVKSLDGLLNEPCYFGVAQNKHQCNTGLGFGAEKGSAVVKLLMDEYQGVIFQRENIRNISCPEVAERALKKIGYEYKEKKQCCDGFTIFPPEYFDPYSRGDNAKDIRTDNTVSIHYYSSTWLGEWVRLRRKAVQLIGRERIAKWKNFFKSRK